MGISGSQKAPLYALSNVARSGATRSGYVSSRVFITIGGVGRVDHVVQLGTLEIVDELNETPNTCRFRVIGATVIPPGADLIIRYGSTNGGIFFAGHVLATSQSYWEKPVNVRTDVSAVDYTWAFGFLKVTKRYTNQSATAIVQDSITTYAASGGFTSAAVAAGLPTIPEITFTNEDLGEALSRTANRIGAYWYVDYTKAVHFFYVDSGQGPQDLVPTHPSLADVRYDRDRSQVLTRVYVEGRGTTLLSAVALGDTMVPVETVDMFEALPDVFLKVSFQGSDGGAQHLSFTEVVPGGLGAIVGPGIAPTAAPTVALAAGAGIDVGTHTYAYTWVTASGETKPSPLGTVTHAGIIAAPTVATTVRNDDGGSVNELTAGAWKPGDTVDWAYSWAAENTYVTSTALSPSVSIVATVASSWWNSPGHSAKQMLVKVQSSSDPRVKWVYLWHRVNGGPWRVWNFGEPTGVGYTNYPNLPPPWEAALAEPAAYSDQRTTPTGGTVYQQTTLGGIAVGPSTVTTRKVYRTVAGGAQLKLLQTLANNTATTSTDAAADATLGANAPATDSSALPQPAGQVAAGETTIIVTSTAAFRVTGGWAVIGNGEQIIRYASLSGNTLTGIPASGIGAVVAAVSFGSTITAAPMLTGIPTSGARAITRALTAGDELYLVVQVDDGARQAQLASVVGGTGIREEWVQDRRLSIGEARARGQATLAERALDQYQVGYTCRDLLTRSGKDITVNLPAPTSIVGTFKIQHVVINNFRPHPNQNPTFTVQASSSRFSFEDLLRLATRDVAR